MENFWFALLVSFLAGSATIIGSLFSFVIKKPSNKVMSGVLGFSAGVMILVSFVELFPKGIEEIGFVYANLFFFIGIGAMFLIDLLIPHSFGGEMHSGVHTDTQIESNPKTLKLYRTGIFTAFGLAIHNFPEGIATFVATLAEPGLGIALGVAIAIHNIPEGIAVAAPIYAATKSHKRAFSYSALSGLAEPLGALIAALILFPFVSVSGAVMAATFAFVAGIMVYVAFDELLPASRSYGHDHTAIVGVTAGMAIMAMSLELLK
ncbi:MAG: zinc transporter ZupT [Armatimonadota bacterium]